MNSVVAEATARVGAENLKSIKTFCRICSSFCGIEVVTDRDKVLRVLPDKDNAFNWRDYCSKAGTAQFVRDHPKRLTSPMKRVGDKYVAVSYELAITEIAAQLNAMIGKHGADAIGTYIGNPGGINVAGAMGQSGFVKAIGTTSAFNVSSIDQNSWHVVTQKMYGSDLACLIPDIDHAKCLLLLGTNPADSGMNWMSIVAQGWERVLATKDNGGDLIIVDPRQTPSTKKATTHVVIKPGEDWAFLLGIIKVIFEQGWEHKEDCAEANGVDSIKTIAATASLDDLSRRCNVAAETIRDVARRFAKAETSACETRTGVSLNRNGTIGTWLSHVLNLICGRMDRKGGSCYNPGMLRDVLQMYNKMSPPVTLRSRIGNYPAVIGAFPLAILPDEIRTPGPRQVRAMIINGGNPVVAGPDGARLDAAFSELDCLIGIDMFQRESHRHAHWLIPGCHFLERDEFYGATNFYDKPFAQLGVAAIAPLNGVKTEFEFFRDLAVAMKKPFMGIRGLNTLIRLSRWVARVTGNPRHAFSARWIWAVLVKTRSDVVKWKDLVNKPGGFFYGEKTYGHFRSQLQTADKRINAAPEELVEILKKRLVEPVAPVNNVFPLQMISRRRPTMMNSWLVESAKHPKNLGEVVEINPTDALALKIQEEQTVTVSSRIGKVTAKAHINDDMPPGIVGMDQGWGSRLFDPQGGRAPELRGVMRNSLVPADEIDELTGSPNLNGVRVNVSVTNV